MAGYTKLWSSIVHSTIWRADSETRLLWITMLALCDQHGEVMASVPGLADAARISVADCERGLEILAAPDPYSRTPDHEGRRIDTIRGGWVVLNHGLYRDLLSIENKRATEAERKRRYRNRTRDCPEMSHGVPECPTPSRQAEAEAEAEAEANTKDPPPTPHRGKRASESLFPIRDSKDPELADWYLEAVQIYPTKDEGHNARSRGWETRRVQRDSPQAQKNFHALTSSGAVSARELYVCAWLASDHWRKAKDAYKFIPNLSSFFSSGEKAPWCNWIEDARAAILEQESEATA